MKDWIRRRWFDLRNGYSYYIAYLATFINFILLFRVNFPSDNLFLASSIVGILGVSCATGIGYAHRKHQMKTDQDSAFEQSRLAAGAQLVLFKMIEGTATNEEITWAKNLLEGIRR
jgi:hypothetical protein